MKARGEMIMEQPSEDTLKVILSGHWKLGGKPPGVVIVQKSAPQDRRDLPALLFLLFKSQLVDYT